MHSKKRVERSFQDPSTVITTYEGHHNHPVPTSLRGHVAGIFLHSLQLSPPPTGFSMNHLHNQDLYNLMGGGSYINNNNAAINPQSRLISSHANQQ
ncbi:hypothetical protein V2J09_019557 [Rumex salicifolius]